MASKVTRDEAAILEGSTLASLLSPLYFAIDQYYLNADIIVAGADMYKYAELANKVCIFVQTKDFSR